MNFKQRLDVAIRRGYVQVKGNKLYVPDVRNMRTIFPGIKSSRYSAVKRAMWRSGYTLQNGLWQVRSSRGPSSSHLAYREQSESRRQSGPHALLAAV